MLFRSSGTYVSLSTGSSFAASSRWIASYGYSAGGWTSQDKYPRTLADVNGDGKADIVGFFANRVYLSFSTGSSFAAPVLGIANLAPTGGWLSQDKTPRTVGDVSGGGKADIVGFAASGVYVALAN